MKKLEWKTIQKTVNELVPQEVNPRVMSNKQMSDLKRSLSKYGLVEIPAIDFNGEILAGHMRAKAMKLLGRGEEIIDVRYPNRKLTEEEAKTYLIASNKISGEWDTELLKSFDLGVLEFAGFDKIELGELWDKKQDVKEDNFNVDDELKKIKKPITKLGDVIILGKSKVICGDCTNPEVLKKLFGDEQASMVLSDPIYNLKTIDYSKGVGGKQHFGGNVNDNRTDTEYRNFIRKSMINALMVSKPDVHIFYWSDQTKIGLMQELYTELGIENKRVCLWIKNGANITPGVAFSKCYEPCTYGVRGRPYLAKSVTDLNEIMNREMTTGNNLLEEITDLWLEKRLPANQYEHSTQKPPHLSEKAIKRCTQIDDIILDSFLGSGSTLIAGVALGRRVYGSELEPLYCDLIVRRWEKLTGQKAIYEKDQETHK
jgi:DNA modification methylase